MPKDWADKANGYGVWFRFITPALFAILGTLILANVADLKKETKELVSHFSNHLAHHQDLEVGYERRITTLETKAGVR